MNSDIVSLIIILICVMLSAYFSATETSFTSLNRIRMKNMAEKGDKRAELVLKLLENFDKLLSTILVGNNIVNIGLSSLATVLFIKLLGGDSGATVSTIVTTIVVLIFGEVSPKSIAKESPETIAKFSAPFLHILMIMLTPVTFLFSQWKKLLSRIFKSSENHGITDEELMTIVEEATQEGDIDDQEGDLIQNAIGFMECEKAGNPDMVYKFSSTSKISFPGSGIAAMAASDANLKDIRNMMKVQTIGHDKVNQLRHVRFFKDIHGIVEHMKKHADILRPKFETVLEVLDKELGGLEIGSWIAPRGGYFISFDALDGCAKAIVAKAKEAGVVLTGAGATFPYGKDPHDSNIRIAPSLPPVEELEQAIAVLCVCLKMAALEKLGV